MELERLARIVGGISFGGFRPRIDVGVTVKVTTAGEHAAILIGIDAVDAMSNDSEPLRLYECFAAPDFEDDAQAAIWVKERCQDVILHEMDEFFRFRGEMVQKPVHPVAEGVFDASRERSPMFLKVR